VRSRCSGFLSIRILFCSKRLLSEKEGSILYLNMLREIFWKSWRIMLLELIPRGWGFLYIKSLRVLHFATRIMWSIEISSLRIYWLTQKIIPSRYVISAFLDHFHRHFKAQDSKEAKWPITLPQGGTDLQSFCLATLSMDLKLICGLSVASWESSVMASLSSLVILKSISYFWFNKSLGHWPKTSKKAFWRTQDSMD